MKLIKQHDERDCGAACLAMIADYYGYKQSVSYFVELTKTDKEGTNIYGIADAAKQIGLEAETLKGTSEELQKELTENTMKFPLIAHVISEQENYHFVVIESINKNKVTVLDPGKGKYTMDIRTFFGFWTGYIITFKKQEKFETKKEKNSKWLYLLSLMKGKTWKLGGVFFLSLIISMMGIAGAYVFQISIDGITKHTLAAEKIYYIFGCVILLYLLQAGIQFVRGHLITKVSRIIELEINQTYFDKLITLPVSSLSVRQTGEYLSRLSDIGLIQIAVSSVSLSVILDVLMVIACAVILMVENMQMFLMALMIIVLYILIVIKYKTPLEEINKKYMADNARMQAYFKESMDGIETVKVCNGEDIVQKKFQRLISDFIQADYLKNLKGIHQDILVDLVQSIGIIIILCFGFLQVLLGNITIGSLMTFYVLLGYFITPFKNLVELQPTIQTALVAVDRLRDILDLTSEDSKIQKQDLSEIKNWKVENLNFRYGNRELILEQVSLNIQRGEKIAIVGDSGCGKTTLAKLFLKFYEAESGDIYADDIPFSDCDSNSIRKQIAYVSQDTFLFADTILNNLKFGNEGVTEEEIYAVCKKCKVDEFVQKLPMGYDTLLEENGVNLSGGQRQRLSIARALLQKPQLLILDEATSNLDTITEDAIKNAIFELSDNISCMIIAHRLSTIRQCDRIYVMDSGKICEVGNHDELLEKKGKYAKLVSNV